MKIFSGFNIPQNYYNSIILIGNFDGIHLGHQILFKRAREFKKKYKCKIGVVTFNPMPKMFFNKKLKNFKLMNFSQKVDQFKKQKVDFLINQKFTKRFSKIKAEVFITKYLNKKIKTKVLFVSNNFRFGNKRVLCIGDNLNTDIKGANIQNFDSLFILNGIHKNEKENELNILFEKYGVSVNYIQEKLKW